MCDLTEELTCSQVFLVLEIELKLIKRGESGLPVKDWLSGGAGVRMLGFIAIMVDLLAIDRKDLYMFHTSLQAFPDHNQRMRRLNK